ncbi:MAG: hypothetical protein KatS3mg085_472 [Candidatus Dojkabacteria bacterium]|nr:MAG: hypothetical protein KatS3mg085_472 [Candidatus Dojkabacteria bacterium]
MKKSLIILLTIFFVCCCLLILGFIVIFTLSSERFNLKGKYQAETPHEGIEMFLADTLITFVDNLDFSSEQNLARSLSDSNALGNSVVEVFEKTKFLQYPEFSKENNSIEAVLNFSVINSDVNAKFDSNWIVEYGDEKFNRDSLKGKLSKTEVEKIIRSFPKLQVTGNLESTELDGEIDFDARFMEGKLYVSFGDQALEVLEVPSDIFSNNFVKLNLNETIVNSTLQNQEDFLTEEQIDFFTDDEDITKLYQNEAKIKKNLRKILRNGKIFSDVEEIDSKLFPLAVNCYNGQVDTTEMRQSFEKYGLELVTLLTPDLEDPIEAFNQTLDSLIDAEKFFDENETFINYCVDKNKNFSGLEVTIEASNFEFKLNYFLKDLNSSKKITKPQDYFDITDLVLSSDGTVNLGTLFSGNLYNLENNHDELTPKKSDEFIYNSNIDWDKYLKDVDEIIKEFENGNIDYEEYLKRFDELNLKYGV